MVNFGKVPAHREMHTSNESLSILCKCQLQTMYEDCSVKDTGKTWCVFLVPRILTLHYFTHLGLMSHLLFPRVLLQTSLLREISSWNFRIMMIFQKSKRKKCRGNIRVKLLMKSRMINRCKKNISIKDIY